MNETAAPQTDLWPCTPRIARLTPREPLFIDPEPLARLQAALGPQGAEDVVCRALEDMAHRLRRLSEDQSQGASEKICRGARSIAAVARQIGLRDLANVATHVLDCASRDEDAALNATLARLFRLGKSAINEIGQIRFSSY